MKNITLDEVIQTYGVENWGAGYFEVNRKGHLAVRPAEGDSRSVDVKELIDDLIDNRRLQLPILLRFPQIDSEVFRSRTRCEPFDGAHHNRGLLTIFSYPLHYDVPAHVSSWLVSGASEP